MRRYPILGLAASVSFACTGNIDGNTADTCTPTDSVALGGIDALTAAEYRNTVRDLLEFSLASTAGAATAMNALPITELPDDPAHARGMFQRMKTDVTDAHIAAWYDIATAVGRE